MDTQSIGYEAKAFEARNLAIFVLVIVGITGVGVGLQVSSGGMPSGISGAVLGVMFLLMPCITAFGLTAISEGKTGIKALWARFWNRNLSLKWLLVVLLTFPVFWLIVNLVYPTLDRQDYPVFDLPNPPWTLVIAFITMFIFAMGEEFGWRGYVLPRLQVRWSALTSTRGGMRLMVFAEQKFRQLRLMHALGARQNFLLKQIPQKQFLFKPHRHGGKK